MAKDKHSEIVASLMQDIERIALVMSTESAKTRRNFAQCFRGEIVTTLRTTGELSESEVQRGADVTTDALETLMRAMARTGSGRA